MHRIRRQPCDPRLSGRIWHLLHVTAILAIVLLLSSGAVPSDSAYAAPPPVIDALNLTKTLVDPSVGSATVGDTVRFEIEVENYSALTITLLPMTDRFFDSDCMIYTGASPLPDNVVVSEDLIIWYDLAPLAPGATKTIQVEFLATAACDPAVNRVVVMGAYCEQEIMVNPMVAEAEVTIVEPGGLQRTYLPIIARS